MRQTVYFLLLAVTAFTIFSCSSNSSNQQAAIQLDEAENYADASIQDDDKDYDDIDGDYEDDDDYEPTKTPKSSGSSGIGNKGDMFAGYQLAYIWTDDYGSREKEVIGFCSNGTFYLNDQSMSSNTHASIGHNANNTGTWKLDYTGGQYLLTLSMQGETAQAPVQLFTDEYGDQRFNINGRAYGYYGKSECY